MLQVRKLRFRRPRPKLIDVDNPDGDLKGSPVELNLAGKDPTTQNKKQYFMKDLFSSVKYF